MKKQQLKETIDFLKLKGFQNPTEMKALAISLIFS